MNFKTSLQRHSLLVYFVLAYIITWGGVMLVAASKGFDPQAIELTDGILMFFAMFLGPSLSSLILTSYLEGKAGLLSLFRRITLKGIGWRGLLPLLTIPLVSLSIFLLLSTGISPVYTPSFNIAFGLVIGAIAGFFEELGWTGFAVPRLLARRGPFASGLILGIVWACWHMLADFWGNFAAYEALWLPYFIIYWLLPLTAYRILMTYAYRRSGSLLQSQLMHFFYTGTLATLSPTLSPIQALIWQAIFAAALWLIVAVVAWRSRDPEGLKALRKSYTLPGVILCIVFFIIVYQIVLFPWMNRWGVSSSEATMPLPGDEAAAGKIAVSTRGVTIQAPVEAVWQWVDQLGQERAGFYSNDWLENLTLADIHNAGEIRSEWQERKVGDHVLGAGGRVYGTNAYWKIPVYEENRVVFLWGSIVALPEDAQTTRLLVRTYVEPPGPVAAAISAYSYDWMHFVMERGMLMGIKARAEGRSENAPLFSLLSVIGWGLAAAGVTYALFARRNWGWGLIPAAYGLAILLLTGDGLSALAGYLWWGIVIAGFLLWGRAWWKGLVLAMLVVILVFVLASQPRVAFGIIFLLLAAAAGIIYWPAITERQRRTSGASNVSA